MKLKLDENGHVVILDGKPVYVHDDGKEIAFDVVTTVATITRLNGEAKVNREAKEEAENKLKAFAGIDDPAEAKKAITVVRNLKDGDLIQAGKAEEIKHAAVKAYEEKIKEQERVFGEQIKAVTTERDMLKNNLDREVIGGSFTRSKYISDKIAIPADLVQSRFGDAFKVDETGKLVAHQKNGDPIYSRAKPGEIASFDEALEILVDQYPNKDHILKGTQSNGDGARQNNGGSMNAQGQRTMKRSEFSQLSPERQQAAAIGKDKVTIVDG